MRFNMECRSIFIVLNTFYRISFNTSPVIQNAGAHDIAPCDLNVLKWLVLADQRHYAGEGVDREILQL
jgi:hypothetical protein